MSNSSDAHPYEVTTNRIGVLSISCVLLKWDLCLKEGFLSHEIFLSLWLEYCRQLFVEVHQFLKNLSILCKHIWITSTKQKFWLHDKILGICFYRNSWGKTVYPNSLALLINSLKYQEKHNLLHERSYKERTHKLSRICPEQGFQE